MCPSVEISREFSLTIARWLARRSGRHTSFRNYTTHRDAADDGSFTVSVLFRVTPSDEVALRGEYLVDPDSAGGDPVEPDWGIEVALVRHIVGLLKELKPDGLVFGQTDVRCGGAMSAIPTIR